MNWKKEQFWLIIGVCIICDVISLIKGPTIKGAIISACSDIIVLGIYMKEEFFE